MISGNGDAVSVHEARRPPTVADLYLGDPRARSGGAGGSHRYSARLYERSDELAEIRHLLRGTSEYPNCPIVIEGLAGTGKTALLNAALEIGRDLGLRIGRARCDAAESAASFGVVRQLFSSMFRHQAMPDGPMDDGTDLARRVLRGGLSATDDPVDVYHSLLLLLETTGDEPVLLGVDDLRSADPLSEGWLQFLARRLTTSSVHLLVTTRTRLTGTTTADLLLSNPSTRRFIVHPLTLQSTTAMINQHLGTDIADEVAEHAEAATGGNPLLIARMLTALDELDDTTETVTAQQIDELSSPIVASAVLSLASTLPAGALELLEAVAVLGECDVRVAGTVAGLDSDQAGALADVLADVGLLGWERPLELVHPFERSSLYAAIKPAHRARLHAHAAQVLSTLGAETTAIVAHLLESDPRGDEWTTSVLVDVAHEQLDLGHIERAAQLLERADREGSQDSLHAEVVRLRAKAEGRLGLSTATDHLTRAARLGSDPVALAETALDLLDHAGEHASCVAILDMLRRAGDQLVTRRPELSLRLQLAESVLAPANARVQHEATAAEFGDELTSSATGRLIAAQHALRSAARVETTHQQLLDTLRSLLTSDVLRGTGLVQTAIIAASLGALVRIGAYTTADPLIRAAIAEAQSTGRQHDAATYTLVLAESLAMRGQVVAAEQELAGISLDSDDVVSQCAAMQSRFFAALRERGGQAPIPVTVIPNALAPGLAELGASAGMIMAEVTARAQLLEGESASALTNFDRLRSAAEQSAVRNPSFAPWRAGRATALAGLGRTKEGVVVARENLQLARTFGSPTTIAEALACAARFQPADVQVALLDEAVELIADTDAELLRCSLLIDLGFARHYAGDAMAARTAFRDGADQATRLGVTRLAGAAGRGLLACGARPRRLQTSGLQSLTPAELRVAKLAAKGHTNGSIAAELFVNLKTVESHLTRAYKKLGISDRAELRSALESGDSRDDSALQVSEAG